MISRSCSAVLLSGGLDSAVLLVDEAGRSEVQPVYVSAGLAWEEAERAAIDTFLAAVRTEHVIRPLVSLSLEMRDVYATGHWAVTGTPPAYDTPDEAVYLPGRNVILVSKAAVFCALAGIPRIVLGTLAGNPFPDATPEFRGAIGRAVSVGLSHRVDVDAPYERLRKVDVVRRGVTLNVPLDLTLSCMNPAGTAPVLQHCGRCSKCRERHDAFVDAGLADRTLYDDRRYVDRTPERS